MRSMVVRVPVSLSPEELNGLEKAATFRARHANLFPTAHSWRHFVRSRREALLAQGLLVEFASGHYVQGARLEAALANLLAAPLTCSRKRVS